MSIEQNKAAVRRMFDEAINQGDLSIADELLSSDYVYRSPGSPDLHGPDGFKDLISMYRSACPDLHLTIDELIADGETVVTRWTGHGTQLGEFMGIAPTGKHVTVAGVIITHFRGRQGRRRMGANGYVGLVAATWRHSCTGGGGRCAPLDLTTSVDPRRIATNKGYGNDCCILGPFVTRGSVQSSAVAVEAI